MLTLLPGLLRLSREGALCLHSPQEGIWCLRETNKSCVRDFTGSLCKPGNISLFLSFTSYHRLWTARSQSIKGPQHPWTAAYQALPSMRLSKQEYWSGLPLPSPDTDTTHPLSRILNTYSDLFYLLVIHRTEALSLGYMGLLLD